MKNIARYRFLQGKKRIALGLLSLIMIGFFSSKIILSVSDITTNSISPYLPPHSGTKDKACYYCHSLNNSHWNDDDDSGHDDEDDDVYDNEGKGDDDDEAEIKVIDVANN